MYSPDGTDINIKKIAELFPNCLTESIGDDGKKKLCIDFDILRQELSHDIIEGPQERYQFIWPEKKKAIRTANTATTMTLRPCRKESVNFETTENLYIEGDNLEVLKLLREDYLGKVKMIYIDPPYNTGNDFVYKDDYLDRYYKERGTVTDESGLQLVSDEEKNTEANGRYHTDWLNVMYSRIRVARDLLSDDGAIFISIDENEFLNLGKICDEIMGAKNLVECLVYDKKAAAKGVPPVNMVVGVHEYIFVYAKDYTKFKFRGIPRSTEGFSNPDNDPRGIWRNTNIKSTTSEVRYTIVDPKTGNEFTDTWAFAEDELNRMIKEGRLLFPSSPRGQVRAKEFYNEFDNANTPIKSSLGLYDAQWNTEMIVKLMGGKFFQNPKHLKLMRDLISYVAKPNDIILDFFSGSATTAHAVMLLNSEDQGNRKFILVQLPEETEPKSDAHKAGYKNICEIGKERIRRAGKKILSEMESDSEAEGLFATTSKKDSSVDIGFRVLKLDSSNMEDVYYKPEDSSEATLFEDNVKPDRSSEDLLFQVMIECNLPLSAKIKTEKISGKEVFSVNNGYLIACFDDDINEEVITAVAKRKPYYFIMRDKSLSSDNVADNFEQIFQAYSKETIRRIL